MPDIGYYHPILVHFTIAFLVAGVAFRLVSLTGRARFTGPAAALLLLTGALLTLFAVRSGDDAHGPAERVPGARNAVVEHEELGEQTRNVFLVVALLEIAALILARMRRERYVHFASAIVGVVGCYYLYQTAEHGGELVYSYAGGVGVRTGDDEEDVARLLLAGIYHQAQLDRENGNHEGAATLIELAEKRHPDDTEIGLLAAESLLLDRKQPELALERLSRWNLPREESRLRVRKGILEADAREALGQLDQARSTIETLVAEFPENQRLKARLESLNR